jgi:hypothetical protein
MTTVFSSKILGNELASGIMSLLENGNCNPWNFGSVHMRSMSSLIQQYLLTLGYILFSVALTSSLIQLGVWIVRYHSQHSPFINNLVLYTFFFLRAYLWISAPSRTTCVL